MMCWLHKSFISWLLSILLVVTYSTRSFAIIIVDVDYSKEGISWEASDGRKISVSHSIRVITFDADQQQIQNIEYLLASDARTSYTVSLHHCDIQLEGNVVCKFF